MPRKPITSLEESHWPAVSRWLAVVGVFPVIVLLTAPFLWRVPPAPRSGDMLEATVRASISFTHDDPTARRAWEQDRQVHHDRVYAFRPMAASVALADAARLLGLAAARSEDPTTASLTATLGREDALLDSWSEEELAGLVRHSRDEVFRDAVEDVIRETYAGKFLVEDRTRLEGNFTDGTARLAGAPLPLSEIIRTERLLAFPSEWQRHADHLLRDQLRSRGLADASAHATAMRILQFTTRPSIEFDVAATEQARAAYPGGSFMKSYQAGQVLRDGSTSARPITLDEADLLARHREAVVANHRMRLAGHAGFVLIAFVLIGFYLKRIARSFDFTARNTILLALPLVLALATSYFFIMLDTRPEVLRAGLFPAGAVGMLGALLLDIRLALQLVTWGCLLFGLQADLDYEGVIVGLFGGYTAVAALHAIRERREVVLAGLLIGLVNAVIVVLLDYIREPVALMAQLDRFPFEQAVVGLLTGLACALMALSALPLVEITLDVTTDMRLLELSGLEHPLLRRLEEEAPGTWQHTLNVAKLAEAAAATVGANVLLVRTGVLFHDVGKLTKPEYFTENQVTVEDKTRHQQLKPQISTLIIRNHVKEGVEMARKARLPERIIDFIQQHHGTSLIVYFYNKALAAAQAKQSKEIVREEDYRYPGPKPQTTEAAIVMLADAVEATATAKLSGRTVRLDEIQQVVRTTVLDKFNHEQFDECSLTMRDLNQIRESFVRTLQSRFHTRIDYPRLEQRPGAAAAPPPAPVPPR